MNIKEVKRQVSFRLNKEEWELFNIVYHDFCMEGGRMMSKVEFIKSKLLGLSRI